MRRETQNLLLLLLGGALLKISLTGAYLRYVKPALQPWLITASIIMVLLAVVAIARDIATARHSDPTEADGQDACPPAKCGEHDHGSRSPWLLLLPVLAIFVIAPPALGSDSVSLFHPAVAVSS